MHPRTNSTVVLIVILAVFAGGGLTGVLLQKYHGVGRILALLSPVEIADSAPVTAPQPPDVLDPSVLNGKRVMVALVFGQSNAGNFGESRDSAGAGVYVFHAGNILPAVDPLAGAAGAYGSVWTRLGPKILEEGLAEAVVFVPVVVGGSQIARWTPEGDAHPRLVAALDALDQAGVRPTHLLWHQGEADAEKDTDPDVYVSRFHEILQSIRERGIEAPVLVSVATLCRAHRPDSVIRGAQRSLVDPARGIFPGPDTDVFGYAYRFDGCHFSTEGMGEYADAWLAAIQQLGEDHQTYLWPESQP